MWELTRREWGMECGTRKLDHALYASQALRLLENGHMRAV